MCNRKYEGKEGEGVVSQLHHRPQKCRLNDATANKPSVIFKIGSALMGSFESLVHVALFFYIYRTLPPPPLLHREAYKTLKSVFQDSFSLPIQRPCYCSTHVQ